MFKLSFRQQVSLGFVVSIALVLVVGIFSYRSLKQLQNDTVWVEHSHQVIKSSDILLQKLVDAETGMRGYVATGNEVFLEPYHAALHVIGTQLNSIKEQTKANSKNIQAKLPLMCLERRPAIKLPPTIHM
jgi:CHASE3 domain sensor protein